MLVLAACLLVFTSFAKTKKTSRKEAVSKEVQQKEARVTKKVSQVVSLLLEKSKPKKGGDTLASFGILEKDHIEEDYIVLITKNKVRRLLVENAPYQEIWDYGANGWHSNEVNPTRKKEYMYQSDGFSGNEDGDSPNEVTDYRDWNNKEKLNKLGIYYNDLIFWEKKLKAVKGKK